MAKEKVEKLEEAPPPEDVEDTSPEGEGAGEVLEDKEPEGVGPPTPEFDIKTELEKIRQEIKNDIEESKKHFQSVTDSTSQKTANEMRRQMAQVTQRNQDLGQSVERILQGQELAGLDPDSPEYLRKQVELLGKKVEQAQAGTQPPSIEGVRRAVLHYFPETNRELVSKGIELDDPRLDWGADAADETIAHDRLLRSIKRIEGEKPEPEEKKPEPEDVDVDKVKIAPEPAPVQDSAAHKGYTDAEIDALFIENPDKWREKHDELEKRRGAI